MTTIYAVLAAFVLDIMYGDPIKIPHIVVGMGKLISVLEHGIRKILPKTERGELVGGTILAILLPALSFGAGWGALWLCGLVNPVLRFVLESLLCWQCLAMKSLRDAGVYVYDALCTGDIEKSREAVGRIVGRDPSQLDAAEVTRAAVESVAESTNDGVIAPLLFMIIGGAPLGMLYKAINTMDSVIGYKNERYLYFGRAAARLDDAANFIPARLAGLLMVASASLCGLDSKNAWRIFKRDRNAHKSPNSAQTEAVAAGALHVRLGGDAVYFGQLVHKHTQGDDDRPIEPQDILRANKLMYCASSFCLILCVAVRWLVIWL